tara:strand:- start:4553 stop:5743 length:1191 start_codon:yes stop_codon:yes gene_type:complete
MSNFWIKKVAQESAAAEVEVMAEPTHDGSAFAVENGEVEALEKDGNALAEDMQQLENITTYIDSNSEMSKETFDAIQVGAESIRKRWGINTTKVAQESTAPEADLRKVAHEANNKGKETLWSRFIAWLKEMANKLKERWIKFSNAGKKLSNRSTSYKAAIKALGEKKDDKISGPFIQGLTINNQFNGKDFSAIKKQVDFAEKVQETQEKILKTAHDSILDVFNLKGDKLVSFFNAGTATVKLNKVMQSSLETTEIVGNRYLAALPDGDEMVYELREREENVPDEVDTPSLPILTQACDALYSVGKDIEKQLLAFRKTNDLRLKIAGLEGKLQGTVDGLDAGTGDHGKMLMTMVQSVVTTTISRSNALSATESYIWKNLGTSLDKYIAAGIAAYNKK